MKSALCNQVGLVRLLRRREVTKTVTFPVDHNFCAPLRVTPYVRAKQSRLAVRVCGAPVLCIQPMGCISEVCNPVVSSVAIDVVDYAGWPLAKMNCPSDPVCKKLPALDLHLDVSVLVDI